MIKLAALLIATTTATSPADIYNLGVDAANGWADCQERERALTAELQATQAAEAVEAEQGGSFLGDIGLVALGAVGGAVVGVIIGVVIGVRASR